MNKYYDYSNAKIAKNYRKRYYFLSEFSKILTMYESTSEEVNELIEWLYTLSNSLSEIEQYTTNINYNHNLKEDEQVDENTFRRNVWMQDLRLYSLVAAVHETASWGIKDTLSEIISELYHKLDDIIHPDPRHGLDYEEVRYYTEIEYINKEKQEKTKSEHNLDFKEENWRA